MSGFGRPHHHLTWNFQLETQVFQGRDKDTQNVLHVLKRSDVVG